MASSDGALSNAALAERVATAPPRAGTLPVGSALANDFVALSQQLLANPMTLVETQAEFWQDYLTLWQRTTQRMLGFATEPVIEPAKDDRRFRHEQWSENSVIDFIKQSYLLSARCLHGTVRGADGLDDTTRRKLEFHTRQLVDALSPSNFAHTNPEVVAATMESGGGNLVKGLENLLDDLERGKGELKVSMTDRDAFEIGRNIATTPGKVVFQNDLMQLVQYSPTTKQVDRHPLLIVPPWINKFYILDLQPKNSFIKFCLDQGKTVFVISWVNPDARHRELGWDAYMNLGPLAALDAIAQATGEVEANVIGYCIGGTLLATVLGHMAAIGDRRFTSATFFTSIMDFEQAGELTLFVDEEQLAKIERQLDENGYLDAGAMATTFNLMRANDLIWSFVVGNYLLGKDALPFDLLYWNSDSTRMPAATHRYYLRNMYQKNLLKEPGGLELKGTPIDLRKVTTPVFLLSAREDHIAPWHNTYAAAGLYAGPVRFVLAGSGHIAGVINPAGSTKYGYWTNDALPADPDAWLDGASQHPGSWWPAWAEWQSQFTGGKVKARIPGQGGLTAIEDAPGSYVKVAS